MWPKKSVCHVWASGAFLLWLDLRWPLLRIGHSKIHIVCWVHCGSIMSWMARRNVHLVPLIVNWASTRKLQESDSCFCSMFSCMYTKIWYISYLIKISIVSLLCGSIHAGMWLGTFPNCESGDVSRANLASLDFPDPSIITYFAPHKSYWIFLHFLGISFCTTWI